MDPVFVHMKHQYFIKKEVGQVPHLDKVLRNRLRGTRRLVSNCGLDAFRAGRWGGGCPRGSRPDICGCSHQANSRAHGLVFLIIRVVTSSDKI